jgi:nucleoid DNA-binding protein
MDELVKLVSKKTGIPEAQAKIAVETVMDFLKKKLPAQSPRSWMPSSPAAAPRT